MDIILTIKSLGLYTINNNDKNWNDIVMVNGENIFGYYLALWVCMIAIAKQNAIWSVDLPFFTIPVSLSS